MLEVEAAEEGAIVQESGEVAAFHVAVRGGQHSADDGVALVQVAAHSADEVVGGRLDESGADVTGGIDEAALFASGDGILQPDRPGSRLAADLDRAKDS